MKGQIYMLESAIAIMMILVIVIFLFQNPPTPPEYKRVNYKLKAYNALEVLEETGELRDKVMDNNVTFIVDKLNSSLPNFLNFTVVIFNDTTNITTKPSLANESEILSVSYLLAGDLDNYQPRDVRVYIWGYD